MHHVPWYRHLYVQTLTGIFLGGLLGYFYPSLGKGLKPIGEGFVDLIKMMIGPIIFCTIVHGVASIGDLRKIGRLGLKSLLYFEVVSTIALLIGLLVVNYLRPGVGFTPPDQTFHAPSVAGHDPSAVVRASKELSMIDFFRHIIPTTIISPFVTGDILQILLVSLLVAAAILGLRQHREKVINSIDAVAEIFFGVLRMLVRLAPLGAFGAMAFTVGAFETKALLKLVYLMFGFYLTSFVFIAGVLGSIAWFSGFSLGRLLWHLRQELVLVLSTSSSETALPGLMTKLQKLGCTPSTVGLVVPTGYSFNLDGTNIYMSMAAVFIAQATNTPMTMGQQLWLLAVAMITSKGASGVTGAGFITLAATLQVIPAIPADGYLILIGIDRFMSECRAITNFIGNSVAAVVISRWENEISRDQLRQALAETARDLL